MIVTGQSFKKKMSNEVLLRGGSKSNNENIH